MRTTKAQQDDTRARIVRAATALIVAQGYDNASMKDIARAAGIGDATIYKYFPTKERLLIGYFDLLAEQAVHTTKSTPDFGAFDLQSRLQRLTDALLEAMAPDRAFVALARDMLAKSPLLLLGDQLKAKQLLKDAASAWLDEAVQAGEIPPSDYTRVIAGLYVDFCHGVIAFWLCDTTKHAAETTRLVDQLLGVLVALLRAGLPDRLMQLAGFMLRSQLARIVELDLLGRHPAQPAPQAQGVPASKRRSRSKAA
jgi:TetR/AcrR family transcriptional regulator, regulator of autoinduction and epiphytic fitness